MDTISHTEENIELETLGEERSKSSDNNEETIYHDCIQPLSIRRNLLHRDRYKESGRDLKRALRKTQRTKRNVMAMITPWSSMIQSIEGGFGSAVGSYFRFVRFVFMLNLVIFIISFMTQVGPRFVYRFYGETLNETFVTFRIQDLLTGKGYLEESEMFYGFYEETLIFSSGLTFGSAYFYFYGVMTLYLFSLFVISIRMARSYRKSFIGAETNASNEFINKIFCVWDYGLKKENSIKSKKEALLNELKELLELIREKKNITFMTFLLRIIVNVVVLGVLAASFWGMNLLLNYFSEKLQDDMSLFDQLFLSIVMTCSMYLIPLLFSYMNRLENYANDRTSIYINLFRTMVLELVFLVLILFKEIENHNKEVEQKCWETHFGQEIYRLMMMNVFILVIGTFVFETFHKFLYARFKWHFLSAPKFDIARNATHIIYVQTLGWLGYYFAPGISILLLLAQIITFYLKLVGLKWNCNQSKSPLRAAQTQTVFMVCTFFSIIATGIFYVYIIISTKPSQNCGPFHRYDYSYEVMVEEQFFNDFFLFKPAVIVGFIVMLLVAIYYTRALSSTYKKRICHIKDLNKTERIKRRILSSMLQKLNK